MTHALARWDDQIQAADGERERRRLLGEIGQWRADRARLSDLPSQRAASYAISTLYHLLGDHDSAVHEASQLVELCRIGAPAAGEVRDLAHRHHARLARAAGKRPGKSAPSRKGPSPVDEAVTQAGRGDLAAARKTLQGRSGARASQARLWIDLLEARASEEPLAALDRVIGSLSERLRPQTPGDEAPKGSSREPTGFVESLIGRSLSTKRKARLNAMERWLEEHPAQAGALAAAAIRDHVQDRGRGEGVPWLFPLVLRGWVEDPDAVEGAFKKLNGAAVVEACQAPGFLMLREVAAAARSQGWRPAGVRRGAAREEPEDRPVWRVWLRSSERREVQVAAVGEASGPWPDDVASALAQRWSGGGVVLWAPGQEHEGLRQASSAASVAVCESLPQVLEALEAHAIERAARSTKPEVSSPKPAPLSAEPAGEGVGPVRRIRELLDGPEDPTPEAFKEPLGMMRRIAVALRGASHTLQEQPPERADPRLAALLEAVHEVAPADVQPVVGARLALETAARLPDGAVATLLSRGDHRSVRYGGQAAAGLATLLSGPLRSGWTVDRLELGVDRSEGRQVPALEELRRDIRGLWRARLAGPDGARVVLWWVADPSPEAVAAALLLAPLSPPDLIAALDAGSASLMADVQPEIPTGQDAADRLQAIVAGG